MSWLPIRGKVLHCEECGAQRVIDYEGGIKPTQIGDLNVIGQIELNEKYMPKKYAPEKEGYYFHIEEVICQNCMEKKRQQPDVGKVMLVETVDILDEFNEVASKYDAKIAEGIDAILLNMVAQINIEEIGAISPKRFKRIKWDKELLKTSTQDELIDLFIVDYKKQITALIARKLEEFSEVKVMNGELQAELKQVEKNILLKMEEEKGIDFYQEIKIFDTDSLNPYICYEHSVRTPIPIEEYLRFYSKGGNEVDPNALHDFLRRVDVLDFIKDEYKQYDFDLTVVAERIHQYFAQKQKL